MIVDVSLVVPAYNEARRLPGTLAGWREFLETQPYTWQLVVVDDGSTDQTTSVADQAGATVIQLRPNQGKGAAVRAGVLRAAGNVIAYVDADMNVAPANLAEALRLIGRGADVVVGRRDLSEYAAAEGSARLLAGGLVQLTRRVVVIWQIRDTQCGFKVLRREVAHAVFRQTRINSFAFDIEVLFLAVEKLGARVVEMPVATTYRSESTFNVRRHLPLFLKDIVQIRLNDLRGHYQSTATMAR